MKAGQWRAFVLCRSSFVLFCFLSSLYLLLAFVPFTYQQIHKGGLLPWLNAFGRMHGWLSLPALAALLVSMCLDRPDGVQLRPSHRRLRRAFVLVNVSCSLLLLPAQLLARPENTDASFVWSLICLAPVFWLALIDWCELIPALNWSSDGRFEDAAVFRAAWQAAAFLALLFTILAYPRSWPAGWGVRAGLFAAAWSFANHWLALLFFYVVLTLLAAVASWFARPPLVVFVLCHLLGAGLMFSVFRAVAFAGISFQGWMADLYAACFSLAAAASVSGISLRLCLSSGGGWVRSGLACSFFIGMLSDSSRRRWRRRRLMVTLGVIAAAAAIVVMEAAKMDWNYLLQKLAVLAVWVVVFRTFYAHALAAGAQARSIFLLLAVLGALAGYRTLQATQRHIWKQTGSPITAAQFLERYAGYDASFKLIHDALPPSRSSDPGFYRLLSRHTNIPRSVPVKPVSVDLVRKLESTAGAKPHIFLFVIDSLRRDYLSPYNAMVDFTPEIGRFAGESCVFENAFSHYGGTGLSEPSIWVGGMLLHKQYVTPFRPMNALQKLLENEAYRVFISRDTILETIVTPWARLQPIDENRSTMDYDLCTTLSELESRLERAQGAGEPVFVYTQPQNIHISVINRQGAKPLDAANYHQFYAPYASRLRRIDACFGQFIRFLKARGLYDNSIIVLTADHGDSLGEEGRWGHAYTIYPEIVRIPLIIHLPSAMRRAYYFNPKLLAFSTDITPSLYYLLGHRPIERHTFFGRPLFTEKPEEQGPYRQPYYLIASSYAAVYGILHGDGALLYVSDAVNFKDYVFDLAGFGSGVSPPSSSMRAEYQELIRKQIEALARWYDFQPPGR